jgi:hypothetical protein
MESLSSLRDMYLQYNKNPSLNGQRGGANGADVDTDTESEEEVWRQAPTQPQLQSSTTEDALKAQLIQNKSNFYHVVMPEAPEPLDQDLLLNTILERDLAIIANVLIQSLRNIPMIFSTSLINIYNQNNGQQNINVNPQKLNNYRDLLNGKAKECIHECRKSLAAARLPINRSESMINDIFVDRVYSFLPEKESVN